MPVNTRQSMAPPDRMSVGAKKLVHGGSLLARPTEASVALSSGSKVPGKKRQPKELTFKQQLLKKTLKDSETRPSGVLALHIKQVHFHDIDSGGMWGIF